MNLHKHTHGHTHTQTHRHTDTDTHTHTNTHTLAHTYTSAHAHKIGGRIVKILYFILFDSKKHSVILCFKTNRALVRPQTVPM